MHRSAFGIACLAACGLLLSGCTATGEITPLDPAEATVEASPCAPTTFGLPELRESPVLSLRVGCELAITTDETVDPVRTYSSNPAAATLTAHRPAKPTTAPQADTLRVSAHSAGDTFLVITPTHPDGDPTVVTLRTHLSTAAALPG